MTLQPDTDAFADPVLAAQAVFRAVMSALARPGTAVAFPLPCNVPAPLAAGLAAVVLALCDHETAVWLEPQLAKAPEIAAYLRFNTGCEIVEDPGAAAFAVMASADRMPPLDSFSQGTDLYPDRSTTVIAGVASLVGGPGLVLEGPGIKERATVALDPLPGDFVRQRTENRTRFPRGVDCLFVAQDRVVALPRTTVVAEG